MTDREDPDRVAAVRRALVRLLDLLAREVVRQLSADAGPTGTTRRPPAKAARREKGCRGHD
jgi:hypothetical protein